MLTRVLGTILTTASLLAVTPTYAASMKDTPSPVMETSRCGYGPFSGVYVGGTVGYARATHEQYSPDAGVEWARGSVDDGQAIGGVHVGFMRQCDRFVFGFEADFNFMRSDPEERYYDNPGVFGEGIGTATGISFLGTLRGRFGIAHDNVLFYGTAGLAYARVENQFEFENGCFDCFYQTDEDIRWGWTIGGGVEIVRDNRWLIRAEGLYVDLREEERNYGNCICDGNLNWDSDLWVFRVGVSMKFHREEPVVETYK